MYLLVKKIESVDKQNRSQCLLQVANFDINPLFVICNIVFNDYIINMWLHMNVSQCLELWIIIFWEVISVCDYLSSHSYSFYKKKWNIIYIYLAYEIAYTSFNVFIIKWNLISVCISYHLIDLSITWQPCFSWNFGK